MLVFCVKQLTLYLMGKVFTVKTDYRKLVHLANSRVFHKRVLLCPWRTLYLAFFQLGGDRMMEVEITGDIEGEDEDEDEDEEGAPGLEDLGEVEIKT